VVVGHHQRPCYGVILPEVSIFKNRAVLKTLNWYTDCPTRHKTKNQVGEYRTTVSYLKTLSYTSIITYRSKMCHGTFLMYSQCGHTVFAGMNVCAGGGPKGITYPNYSLTNFYCRRRMSCVHVWNTFPISLSSMLLERGGDNSV
jgi:hypothetical protein